MSGTHKHVSTPGSGPARTGIATRAWLWLLGGVIVAAGLFFTLGGAKLVSDIDLIPRKGKRKLLGRFLRHRKAAKPAT